MDDRFENYTFLCAVLGEEQSDSANRLRDITLISDWLVSSLGMVGWLPVLMVEDDSLLMPHFIRWDTAAAFSVENFFICLQVIISA